MTGVPCLWVDASRGASGDMLLGALLDAGAPLETVRSALAGLATEPVGLGLREVHRHGLRAAKADVFVAESTTTRNLGDVLAVLDGAGLEPPVHEAAARVFRLLAAAEAKVHGVSEHEVHFHEVGALDALADVVGCAAALHSLGVLAPGARIVVGRVALGSGSVRTAHGELPVPVPAVLELLSQAGAPVHSGGVARELCTPTGAALLAALASGWGDLPAMTVHAAGVGAGQADPPQAANVLRVVVGEAQGAAGWAEEELVVVESTVDDLDPRLWPDVLDALHAAGAVDAWATPVLMRKGRPGHVVTALCPAPVVEGVCATLVAQAPTLGLRTHPVRRRSLPRTMRTVHVDGEPVRVKLGLVGGEPVTRQPEYADVRAAAARLGLPVRRVLELAAAAAAEGSFAAGEEAAVPRTG
ncbi:nickel pincer cofactor biosynthesis protein LarC [Motilibacter deserti]|uniref:nickel pincer cofactor biosynthesis protein LarC n=1 Tax=Motilibacter deserti TaxID=2714956 RepID=UPI002F2B51D0